MTPSRSTPFSGRTVARSALWRFAEVIGGEGAALLTFIVMARLLAPEHFGVLALAGVVISAAQVVLQQGLSEALIQGAHADEPRVSTAFWLNTGCGLGLMALVILLARPLGTMFGDTSLAPVLTGLSVVLPLNAMAAIFQARLLRRMVFKVVAVRVLVAAAAGGAVGLGLAVAGAGVWALVGQQLTAMAVGLLVVAVADRWRPRLAFDQAEARALARFALPLMGTHFTKFAGKKLDLAILGLFVSTTSLGHYFLATRLIFALGLATHYTVSSLTLPVLSRLAHAPAAFRAATARTLWVAVAFCLPAGLGVALVAEPLVMLVFSAAWAPSIQPLRLLAGLSIFYALGLIAGQILVAAGRPGLFFRLTLVNTGLFVSAVAIAAPFGLSGVALAGGLANALLLPAYLFFVHRQVGLHLAELARQQAPVWGATGLMTILVLATQAMAGPGLPSGVVLALSVLVGIASYAIALRLLAGRTLQALAASLQA